jgi:hypothetical protein
MDCPTLYDCFNEKCKDQIRCALEQIEDTDITDFIEDPFLLKELVIQDFYIQSLYDTEEDCFEIIKNDMRVIDNMIDFIKNSNVLDKDIILNAKLIDMFNYFTRIWVGNEINGDNENMEYLDMIDTALKTEVERIKRE